MSEWLSERNNDFFTWDSYKSDPVITLFYQPAVFDDGKIEAGEPITILKDGSGTVRGFLPGDIVYYLNHFKQICQAVEYYQNIKRPNAIGTGYQCIIHRDLKPRNILFDNIDDRFVISDFGLARFHTESKSMTELTRTLYSAPEQDSTRYTKSVDIHALGIILFELMYPQTRSELNDWIFEMKNGKSFPKYLESNLPVLLRIITGMISDDPTIRPEIGLVIEVIENVIIQMKDLVNRPRITLADGTPLI